jgi:hypothetical protein
MNIDPGRYFLYNMVKFWIFYISSDFRQLLTEQFCILTIDMNKLLLVFLLVGCITIALVPDVAEGTIYFHFV